MVEESKNPLLEEIRQGLGQGTTSTQNTKDAIDKQPIDDAKKEEVKKALDELKRKMAEIDTIIAELKRREEKEKNSPKRTEKLLTEIQVPSLELLK